MAILQSATWRSSWGWNCLAATVLIASAGAAEAGSEPRFRFDINETVLPDAVARLALAAHVSIGADGNLPQLQTRPLHGKWTIDAALAQLLKGAAYRARRVGPTAWRIERTPRPDRAAATRPMGAPAPAPADIVVRATKREFTLADAPLAAAVVTFRPAARLDPTADAQRVAERIEGLSVTGQGPGRNRMFLRGVADSPFGGKSQATVAVLLDDARLTFIAPDPDIRLVDVDRVELLKGPQGSLYGSGALGGIYRIVTHRADLSTVSAGGSLSGETIAGGEIGGSGSAVVNIPLVQDVAAVRLVAYDEKSPGWLNTGDRKDSNGASVYGLRAGFGFDPGAGWRADATLFGQWLQARDSNYTYEPEAHSRPSQLPEPHDNDLVHGSLRVAHEGASELVLSTGYTVHDVDDHYDATQGAESFGIDHPQTLVDDAHYRVWDSEARMTGKWGRIGWLGGLSYVEAWQEATRVLTGLGGDEATLERVDRHESEAALFGEATIPLGGTVDATLGGRLFDTILHEDRTTSSDMGTNERNRFGFTPSASLAWHARTGRMLYLRYGAAQRQGGTTVDASGEIQSLDEDDLQTLEGGWRETIGVVDLDFGLYQSWWHAIQSDQLLANGLVEAANVGDASITGGELSMMVGLDDGWRIDGGAMLQSALLTHNLSGHELDDRRLPVVPSWTLRGAVSRDLAVGGWEVTVSANARYVGAARLSFDAALDRPMGNYLETGLELQTQRGRWALALDARNVFNARGNSFAYGNPLRIFSTKQYVRQDPRLVSLSIILVP